jgi:DNA-binding MarR family transcriptional regulator
MPGDDDALLEALVELAVAVHCAVGTCAAPYDLSAVQARLLSLLRCRTPRMAELAALMRVEKSSVTGLVDRAESRGLVRRVPAPGDRRASTVELTAEGARLGDELCSGVAGSLAALLDPLDGCDRAVLLRLLTAILPVTGRA